MIASRWSRVLQIFKGWGLAVMTAGLMGSAVAAPSDSTQFDDGRAAFAVQFGETVVRHRIMAVTALPDTAIRIAVEPGLAEGHYRIEAPEPHVVPLSGSSWRFATPSDPGLYPVVVTDAQSGATVRLQVFVLAPWDHEGRRLNGYHIGRYEREPRNGRAVYEPPEGFVEVTAETKDALVSPHFRLNQFLCKQTDEMPQYALVRPRLLRHLEQVLAAVNARGHDASTLHVMSGYRTPYYNRAIGNTTEYSRHLYGDAADIYVDANGDRWMDDLTGDGRVTTADARELANIVRRIPTPGDDRFRGGLSAYGSTAHHGPFVHLDLRGRRVRW